MTNENLTNIALGHNFTKFALVSLKCTQNAGYYTFRKIDIVKRKQNLGIVMVSTLRLCVYVFIISMVGTSFL